MKVAIQCIDRMTGDKGTFGHFGDFRAITPIYPDFKTMLDECKRLNIELELEA